MTVVITATTTKNQWRCSNDKYTPADNRNHNYSDCGEPVSQESLQTSRQMSCALGYARALLYKTAPKYNHYPIDFHCLTSFMNTTPTTTKVIVIIVLVLTIVVVIAIWNPSVQLTLFPTEIQPTMSERSRCAISGIYLHVNFLFPFWFTQFEGSNLRLVSRRSLSKSRST